MCQTSFVTEPVQLPLFSLAEFSYDPEDEEVLEIDRALKILDSIRGTARTPGNTVHSLAAKTHQKLTVVLDAVDRKSVRQRVNPSAVVVRDAIYHLGQLLAAIEEEEAVQESFISERRKRERDYRRMKKFREMHNG